MDSRQVRRAAARYRAPVGLRQHGTAKAPLLTREERRMAQKAARRARPVLTHKQEREKRRAGIALDVRFHPGLRA